MTRQDRPASDDEELFRPEMLAARQNQWLGSVLLAPRVSHTLFAAFALVLIAGMLALLFLAGFTQKARIAGWLVPEQGTVRVLAPQPGHVARLYVTEGMRVTRGMPLALISSELESPTMGRAGAEVVRRLGSRRASIAGEQQRQRALASHEARELSGRIERLRADQASFVREIGLHRQRMALAGRGADRLRQLQQRGLVTAQRADEAEQDRLEHVTTLEALQRARSAAERDRRALEAELREMPLKTETQLAVLEREMTALDQEVVETEAQREFVITAAQDGIVTAIQATAGGTVGTTTPLLTILPLGSSLEAQLFSPSRAIGFVRPGQTVVMRYQAYPYQKFGTHRGTVTSVSRSAINPSELAQFPSNLLESSGAGEPLYRITVKPSSQTVLAYGERRAMQPGMLLEADVVLERRRLIEWLLDPLYTLTGR